MKIKAYISDWEPWVLFNERINDPVVCNSSTPHEVSDEVAKVLMDTNSDKWKRVVLSILLYK